MELKDKNIGFCFTGSFCTFDVSINEMKKLVDCGANVFPIMSFISYGLDTKFGKAEDFIKKIEDYTGKKIINSIISAEPIRS